jgi:hypothetical protein
MLYTFKKSEFLRRGSPVGPTVAGVYALTKVKDQLAFLCNHSLNNQLCRIYGSNILVFSFFRSGPSAVPRSIKERQTSLDQPKEGLGKLYTTQNRASNYVTQLFIHTALQFTSCCSRA